MVNIPFREVGSVGCIADVPPHSLPATAWSSARNVYFNPRGADRAPEFVQISSTASTPIVKHVAAQRFSSEDFDDTFLFGPKGECGLFRGGEEYQDLTPDGQVLQADTGMQYTSAVLSDILYVNRPDLGIRYVSSSGTKFAALPNLDSAWKCQSLRAFKDFLIALNVNKDGVAYENLVKWSNATLEGQVPSDWDYTLATNKSSLAGENPLADLRGPLVDGLALGNSFILYGRDEVWIMDFAGDSTNVFTFRRLFGSGGHKSQNCAVEVNGWHYVFGLYQIYRHDGVSIDPFQEGKNNDTVMKRIDVNRIEECFVCHDQQNMSVLFCYPLAGQTGCNEALAYNYKTDTATFIDLPGAAHGASATPYAYLTWQDVGSLTWADSSGSSLATWKDGSDPYRPTVMMGGYGPDDSSGNQKTLWLYQDRDGTYTPDPALNQPMVMERVSLYLDNAQLSGANIPLRNAKKLHNVIPLVSEQTAPIQVDVGYAMTDTATAKWTSLGTFDGASDYQLGGGRVNGRALSIRFTVPSGEYAVIQGWDMDVGDGGGR